MKLWQRRVIGLVDASYSSYAEVTLAGGGGGTDAKAASVISTLPGSARWINAEFRKFAFICIGELNTTLTGSAELRRKRWG